MRDCINKYLLERNHLHFLGGLVDCTFDSAQLKNQVGTVDFKDRFLIESQIESFRKNGTWSSFLSLARS